jgi:hypothetical protein
MLGDQLNLSIQIPYKQLSCIRFTESQKTDLSTDAGFCLQVKLFLQVSRLLENQNVWYALSH